MENKYKELIDFLQENKNQNINLVIDGRCGAGKTTLADMLEDIFDCTVIHLDDFFLPPKLRSPERLNMAGGNVHFERFNEEVAPYLLNRKDFSYKKFSCKIMDYIETISVNPKNLIIIEGSYSCSPYIDNHATKTVFMDINKSLQKERIINRNGIDRYMDFENKWIPMEEKYFSKFDIQDKCDFYFLA